MIECGCYDVLYNNYVYIIMNAITGVRIIQPYWKARLNTKA